MKAGRIKTIIAYLIICGGFAFSWHRLSRALKENPVIPRDETPVAPSTGPVPLSHNEQVAEAVRSFSLKKSWTAGGFGTVLILSGCGTNNYTRPVKDIELSCSLYSESGTEIGSKTAHVLKVFPQKKRVCFSDLNVGFIDQQTDTVSCSVVGLSFHN